MLIGMRVIIDQAYYDKVVDAFRASNGSIKQAARLAKISPNTARKAWHMGWENLDFPPVQKTLELEMLSIRKERTAEMDDRIAALKADKLVDEAAIRAAARRDAVTARIEESKMIKAARQSAIGILESCKSISAALADIGPAVATAVRKLESELEEASIKELEQVMRLLWRLSQATRSGAATAHMILQSERLLLGQPTDIIGVTDMNNMTETEAETELEEATAALKRMRRRKAKRGNLRVVDGGS